jgi:ribA/ribD-fused uncharacterized protein
MPDIQFNSKTSNYAWLSNFAPSQVCLDGVDYPTVEHAYQAAKTLDKQKRAWIQVQRLASHAKSAGRGLTVRPGWEKIKPEVMRLLLEQKFRPGSPLADQLVATGTRRLVHYCPWGDRLWGVDRDGRGQNLLGELIMLIRVSLMIKQTEEV